VKLIVDQKDRKVLYDESKNLYIKEFYPKMKNRIKYFFKLRKYPGINFNYVAKELNKIGVKTPKIIKFSKYKVVTSEIKGITLKKYLEKNQDEELIEKYLNILVKMLNNKIYYRDLGPGNFIYDGKNIYAIDLEGYHVKSILTGRNKELKERLQKGLKNEEWVDYILERLEEI